MKPLFYCYLQYSCAFNENVLCHSTGCHDASRQNCHAKFDGVFWQPFLVLGSASYFGTILYGSYGDSSG